MTGKIINPATGKPFVEVRPNNQIIDLREQIIRTIRAKYDAAQTNQKNELHWLNADLLSPHSSNSLSVRKKLRSRSRYETANNGYLLGIQLSLANDLTGSGPSLQITDKRFTEPQRRIIEERWKQRAKKIKLRRKIWRLKFAKSQDGEGFAFAFTDRRRTFRHPVRLNQRVIECDQVSHFNIKLLSSKGGKSNRRVEIDGIRFDPNSSEPVEYHLLNDHPGETTLTSLQPLKGKWVPADQVIHWFRQDRGWLRAIPETAATLPLWALLRRYTLAVVSNAEIAADFTVLLQSLQTAASNPFATDVGNPSTVAADDWFDSFPVDHGLMTVVPGGQSMLQLKPEQPVTVYDTFVNALVQEASRPLLAPKNIALGSSGDFNMASANFDRQLYRENVRLERLDCEEQVLDVDLNEWWFEAIRIPGYFQDDVADVKDSIEGIIRKFAVLREDPPEHIYRWDEVPEHVDPVKVAQAIDILHRGAHISDTDIQEGRYNRPVETHYENLERQNKWRNQNNSSTGSLTQSTNTDSEDRIGDLEDKE